MHNWTEEQKQRLATANKKNSKLERLSAAETGERIRTCFELRYIQRPAITQPKWVEYCKEHYGDKSGLTYTKYWLKAGEMYDSAWKDILRTYLLPAVNKIGSHLESVDEKIQQKAVEQVFKYSGAHEDKIRVEGNSEINLKWGKDETDEA